MDGNNTELAPKGLREIVAAKIGHIVTNDPAAIAAALQMGETDIEFLERKRMQLMSAFDLGPEWDKLAAGPTLFLMDEDDNPYPAQ